MLVLMQDALLRLGVHVRVEELPEEAHVRGGVCRYGRERVLFVSPAASSAERRDQMLSALAGLDAEALWLPPLVRQWLERHREATPPGHGESGDGESS